MQAFIVDRYGKDSVARADEIPTPEIGEHDVLVRIHVLTASLPEDDRVVVG